MLGNTQTLLLGYSMDFIFLNHTELDVLSLLFKYTKLKNALPNLQTFLLNILMI